MNDSLSTPARQRLAGLGFLAARWLLGALFLCMGLGKALHPLDFLKLVRQYDLVQIPLALNLIGACLPWFEVFCGLLLLAGRAVRGTALALVIMLIPFTALIWHRALLLHAAVGLPFCAIKFDCGCGAGEVFICHKLAENAGLILLCCLLMCWCYPTRTLWSTR